MTCCGELSRGLGGVVLVEGEPGIGKSLLLREAVGVAAGHGFSLAAGAADQLGRALPFFALRTALGEPFARLTAGDPERDLPDAPGWWISQMSAHLEQRAAANPVLVCLDDLQWASPATLTALRTLPRDLKHHPVAWLLARASTPQHDTEYLFGLLEKDGAARVTLAPLDQDAVAAMLIEALGVPPDQALMDLAGGAAGNPSLLTELIRGLGDDKAVQVTGSRAVLVSTRLPQRVHRVAQHRLDGLSKQARHLLVTAAVLGSSFRLEDAAEMLGETPAGLLPTVEEAMDTGIMAAADNTFSFRHELLRRAVGEMIPRPARKALHRQYSQILFGRGEVAALAAGHLLQAAHPDDPASLADLDTAAVQTLRSAPQTAADLALRALELTPPADPGALSRAVAATEALTAAGRLDQAARLAHDTLAKPLPPVAEAGLRCALSSVLRARGQASDAVGQAEMVLAQPQLPHGLREEALTAHLQALAGSRDGLAGPLADTILADPSQHDSHTIMAALAARAVIAWDNGQISEALGLLRDAARYGTGISPDARHPQPLLALAAALVDLRQLDEADSILRAADHPALHGIPAHAGLRILRARIHLANGRLADAVAAGQAALASAETLGADGYASTAHCVLAVIALRRGDIAAAAQHIAGQPAPMPHFPGLYARTETTLAQAQISEARDGPAAAISHIRQAGIGLPAHQGLLSGDPGSCGLAGSHLARRWRPAPGQPGHRHRRCPRRRQPGVPGPGRGRGSQPRPRHLRHGTPRRGRGTAPRPVGQSLRRRRPRRPARQHGQGPGHQAPQDRPQRIPPDRRRPRPGPHQAAAARARRPPPPLDHTRHQAHRRLGQPHRHRAGRLQARRRRTEQQPGRRPHVHQHPYRRPPSAPGIPQTADRVTRRTGPHRHRGRGSRLMTLTAALPKLSGRTALTPACARADWPP